MAPHPDRKFDGARIAVRVHAHIQGGNRGIAHRRGRRHDGQRSEIQLGSTQSCVNAVLRIGFEIINLVHRQAGDIDSERPGAACRRRRFVVADRHPAAGLVADAAGRHRRAAIGRHVAVQRGRRGRDRSGHRRRHRRRRDDRLRSARRRGARLVPEGEGEIGRRQRVDADRFSRRGRGREVGCDEDVPRAAGTDGLGQRRQRMGLRAQGGGNRAQQRVAAKRAVRRIPDLEVHEVGRRIGARGSEADARQRRVRRGHGQLRLVQDDACRARIHGRRPDLRSVVRQSDVRRSRDRRHVHCLRVVARAIRIHGPHAIEILHGRRQPRHQLTRPRHRQIFESIDEGCPAAAAARYAHEEVVQRNGCVIVRAHIETEDVGAAARHDRVRHLGPDCSGW